MIRGYKNMYCVKFVDSNFSWGGSDSSYIMLDSSDTIPTNISTTTVLNSSVSSGSGTKTYSFISPNVFDIVSVMDGTASGSFRLYAHVDTTGTSSAYVKITSVDITLEVIDNDGNAKEIFAGTVWTGTHQANLDETEYLGIMYWFSIGKEEVAYNERLKVTIDFDYTAYDPLDQTGRSVGIVCSPDDKDMTLSLPFIV
jgi:hypothetical protein